MALPDRAASGAPTQSVQTESLDGTIAKGAGLAVGQIVLEKYRVLRQIGAGGMAEVYEATHLTLNSRVALKLPLGRVLGARTAARLLREAQVSASLDPDRVVRVLDVGMEGATPIIVMELLEGETLRDRLDREKALPQDVAAVWVRDAARAVAEAHARGIVHRDLKPSNLFIEKRRDGGERLKLLDFGVASIRAAATGEAGTRNDSGVVGSPPYMAPEQVRAGQIVDSRSDVWALGITLFELVAGERPFKGKPAIVVGAILREEAPLLGARAKAPVAPELEAIVNDCLAKDPARRPADAGALAAQLDNFVAVARRGTPAKSASGVYDVGAEHKARIAAPPRSRAPLSARVPRQRVMVWLVIAVVVTAATTVAIMRFLF